MIFSLVDVYLRDLIIDTEGLLNIVKEQNIKPVLWLLDYEKYDYSVFDVIISFPLQMTLTIWCLFVIY